MLKFRHELKHEITYSDMIALRHRLCAVAKPDSYAKDGKYMIRSLYFETITDKALREKQDGVSRREKFRIRYYNLDTSKIYLEKKSKVAGVGNKQKAALTNEQAQDIVDGRIDWMKENDKPLIQELHRKMCIQGLKPKTIVDYTREPYVFYAGNVRVTLDYDIRTGLSCTDFLNTDCPTMPAGEPKIILELKWDEFLPDIIRDAVRLESRCSAAFSKYAICRIYG